MTCQNVHTNYYHKFILNLQQMTLQGILCYRRLNKHRTHLKTATMTVNNSLKFSIRVNRHNFTTTKNIVSLLPWTMILILVSLIKPGMFEHCCDQRDNFIHTYDKTVQFRSLSSPPKSLFKKYRPCAQGTGQCNKNFACYSWKVLNPAVGKLLS